MQEVAVYHAGQQPSMSSAAIDSIPNDGVSDGVHVDAYLVSPTSEGSRADKGDVAKILEHLEFCACGLATRHDCHTFTLRRVARYRAVNNARLRRAAGNERDVFLVDGACLELLDKPLSRVFLQGNNEEP